MTFDDIIKTAIGVLAVAAFGICALWGIRYNPADTIVALLSFIGLCMVCYAVRD